MLCTGTMMVVAACGGGSTVVAPTEAVGKLTAANVPCAIPKYEKDYHGNDTVTRIWCNLSEADTSGYEVFVFDSADGLGRWLAEKCADVENSGASYMREEHWAFGANWYTTRADSAVTNDQIAEALDGTVSTIAERCNN